jgi:hypothetical protein
MDRLTLLPDELLVDIVERVRAASPDTLPNIGSTCKRLQRLTHPLQWNHVVIPWRLKKHSPIARFNEAHNGNENILSVRLRPQRSVMNAFRIGMKNAHDHLDALCICLGSLPNLSSFSIYLDGEVDSRCTLPGPVLTKIVRALPPSLRHLEIDTEAIDRIGGNFETVEKPVEPASHLCLAVSDRMSHLESLRLRVSCLCTQLFGSLSPETQKTSKLRRAFIRLDNSPEKESHLSIPVVVRDCELPRSAPRAVAGARQDTQNALTVQKVMTHLMYLQKAGAFPELERFVLWKWTQDDLAGSGSHFRVRDVARRSITYYPKAWVQFNIKEIPELNDVGYESVYMVRDHNHAVWLGDRKMLEAALLHEVYWRETADGARVAPNGELDRETHLCVKDLVSWDVVKAREDELVRSGLQEHLRLPNMAEFANTTVLVDKL